MSEPSRESLDEVLRMRLRGAPTDVAMAHRLDELKRARDEARKDMVWLAALAMPSAEEEDVETERTIGRMLEKHKCAALDEEAQALDDAEARVRRKYEALREALREMLGEYGDEFLCFHDESCPHCKARELLREREEVDGE